MATKTTGWKTTHSASIVSSTDTTATIRVYAYWQNNGWTYDISHVSAWVYCGGSSYKVKSSGSISATSSTSQKVSCGYHDFTVDKSTAAKSVSCYAKITSESSYVSGTKSSTAASISVPAKTSYSVTYNANGGSGAPSAQTKWYGTALTLSSASPTRTGYTFQGWSTSSNGSVVYAAGASYSGNAALNLYAVWKVDTYTITYNANGGAGVPANQTKTYGTDLVLSTVIPTRTNYNFLGWSTSDTATTATYTAGGNYTNNAAATLYAVWELAYIPPTISGLAIFRCLEDGSEDDFGVFGRIIFSWETCQLVGDNPIYSAIITYGQTSETISVNGNKGLVDYLFGNGELDMDLTYSVKITITDSMNGSTSETRTLGGGKFPIDFKAGGGAVAIGKPCTIDDTLEVDFKAQFNKSVTLKDHAYDKFGNRFGNGLGSYGGSGTNAFDPDTAIEHHIITDKNIPADSGFMHIITYFYGDKSDSANRTQIAIPYNHVGSMYHRQYYNGEWTDWRRHVNGDETMFTDYIVAQGTAASGTWKGSYRKWNSGKAEVWYSIANYAYATTAWSSPIYYRDYESFASIFNNVCDGIFVDVPENVTVTPNSSQFFKIYPYTITKDGVSNMRFLSVGSKSNVEYAFSLYAVGKWK